MPENGNCNNKKNESNDNNIIATTIAVSAAESNSLLPIAVIKPSIAAIYYFLDNLLYFFD